jgi:Flp pilus assembly protein TadG
LRKSLAVRRHRRLEGAAAVEVALVLPLFSILLLGLIDFGHFFFTMNTITNAAREAARRASVQPDAATIQSAGLAAANEYLQPAALAPGVGGGAKNCSLNCPTVNVSLVNPGTTNATVNVTIQLATFKNITGFTYRVMPGFTSPFASLTNLQQVSQMRWELAPNP